MYRMPWLVAAACLLAAFAAEAEPPGVWMCHTALDELAADEAQWEYVRERLDGVQFYLDPLSDYSEETLEALAAMTREANLAVTVEAGGALDYGPLDDTSGAASAERELEKMQRFLEAGGSIGYITLRDPIQQLLEPSGHREGFERVEDCIDHVLQYLQRIREDLPDTEFFLLTNFPNWGWRGEVSYHARGERRMEHGDYYPVLERVLARAEVEGAPFKGVTVDNPYEYATGERPSINLEDPAEVDWMDRIRDLQRHVMDLGYEFNMIINSETGGGESGEAFHERTLQYLELFHEGEPRPTRYIIQSWYVHPRPVLPETEPGAMSAVVRDALEFLDGNER